MRREKKIVGRIRAPGPTSDEEQQRLQDIRDKAMKEFPPRDPPRLKPATSGIGAQIRSARESQGLTWYSLAEKAGIPNASIVRDIEYGREVTLANIEAVVAALGLKLELVAGV
ncbi:MAG: helix-turn-helix domain-containing protein [Pirellulales bacterium]